MNKKDNLIIVMKIIIITHNKRLSSYLTTNSSINPIGGLLRQIANRTLNKKHPLLIITITPHLYKQSITITTTITHYHHNLSPKTITHKNRKLTINPYLLT